MRKLLTKLIMVLLGLSAAGAVDIYRWRDDSGKVYFSDKLRQGAELLRLKPGHSYYGIKYVYDGDTVTLDDGRKVRLLGINTPEIEGRSKSAEAGGQEARRWLIDALKGKRVRLVVDAEPQDKYGRTLAHLFTDDGRHINLELVKAGLAAISIYPPNLLYSEELIGAQVEAEKAKRGIWRLQDYRVKPVAKIRAGEHRGWQRISGRIRKIRTARKFVYLAFDDRVDIRIERANLALFPDLGNYVGKTVEVRGWLNKSKERFSMLIRHPSAVKVI